jgi:hypothetical protein
LLLCDVGTCRIRGLSSHGILRWKRFHKRGTAPLEAFGQMLCACSSMAYPEAGTLVLGSWNRRLLCAQYLLFVEATLARNVLALGNCLRFPLVRSSLTSTKGRLSMVISAAEKWSPIISARALGSWCGGSPFPSSCGAVTRPSFTGIIHAP